MVTLIVALVVYVVQGMIFGFAAQQIAESKGYSTGFAWGFWLGVIGLVVVGLKPNLNATYVVHETPRYAQPAAPAPSAPSANEWVCVCGSRNHESLTYCTRCGRERSYTDNNNSVKVPCPHCGARNKTTNKVCFACGKSMTAEAAAAEPQPQAADAAELLTKLAQLHESGVLTDEEFQEKKAEILRRI